METENYFLQLTLIIVVDVCVRMVFVWEENAWQSK